MDDDHGRYRDPVSDEDLLARSADLLDALGPFASGTRRADKWRTTEQLAHALADRLRRDVNLDRLDALLRRHETEARTRLVNGQPAAARIRRATYPDRTTALPLWGSTSHHGQPWVGQALPERMDPPDDVPSDLRVDASRPRVFLSHAQHDVARVVEIARELASMEIGTWMFETDIGYRGNIAACVREAIGAATACASLVTRVSIASLWVLTELHTALQCGKPVWLIVDTSDAVLMRLLASLQYHHPEAMFDTTVACDQDALEELGLDYARRNSSSRAARYQPQVRDFLATVPLYLSGRPALAHPAVPDAWQGPVPFAPLTDLRTRIAP